MDFKLIINGKVEKGKISMDRVAFQKDLQKFEGREVELTISVKKVMRSNKANRYYHGIVIAHIQQGLKDCQGLNPSRAEVHEWLKSKFCYKSIACEHSGEYFTFPQSTAELTVSEFYDYIEKCRSFALDFLNVDIPASETTNIYSGF